MGKGLGSLLVLAAVVAAVLFLLTGAGTSPVEPTALSDRLGPHLVGTPWLAVGAGAGYVLGILLLGRPKQKTGEYALREVVLASSVGAGAGLAAALVLGVARLWSTPTLAVLAAGGALETLVAIALSVRIAIAGVRSKLLFVPALVCTLVLLAFYVAVAALGSS